MSSLVQRSVFSYRLLYHFPEYLFRVHTIVHFGLERQLASQISEIFWTSEILECYLISNSKLASSVVKGIVPETTRIAVSRLSRFSDRLP